MGYNTEDIVETMCKGYLKKFFEKLLFPKYQVVTDLPYEMQKKAIKLRRGMGTKTIFGERRYGSGNGDAHQAVQNVLLSNLPTTRTVENGEVHKLYIGDEMDYNRVGMLDDKRPLKPGEKNYNFDIAIVDAETKDIVVILEIERGHRKADTRHKLCDCLGRIPSLKHAFFIEINGNNPYQFNFCELVKGIVPSTRNQGRIKDGCTEINVSEICGVSVQMIESQVRKRLSLLIK